MRDNCSELFAKIGGYFVVVGFLYTVEDNRCLGKLGRVMSFKVALDE